LSLRRYSTGGSPVQTLKAGAEFNPIPIRQDDLADHFVEAIMQSEAFCPRFCRNGFSSRLEGMPVS